MGGLGAGFAVEDRAQWRRGCALRAQHGTDLKACAEALRDQIRVRVHVYKIKAADFPNIGSGSSEAAVQRLAIELRAVVVGALPRSPPPPVPYPTRAVHRAPTAEAAAFHMKHLAAISAALVEVVTVTVDGAFKAPRRRAALAAAATPRAQAPMEPTPKAPKRPRAPTPGQAAFEGVEFEEDGVDWKVLAVAWDGELEEVVVWYYDVEMAEEGQLSEDDMHLARTQGLDLAPLEFSGISEVKAWIKAARSDR